LVLVLGFAVGVYNALVRRRNSVKNAFAQIDVQLKRRYELIPNLVETAKAYIKHEAETLEAVIKARNQAFAAAGVAGADPTNHRAMEQLSGAENILTQSLGRLMMVMESYPDLKADRTMTALIEELTSTENKVAFSRQAFNDAVMTYNNSREVFPNSLIAGSFGFEAATLLEITNPQERDAVRVQF
jgi:LemA protein